MRKTIAIIGLLTISLTSTAFASPKAVANCGSYQLRQDTLSTYFGGILHQENTYSLADVSGGENSLSISTNSEGATLEGMTDVKASPSGAISSASAAKIAAMWGEFKLTVVDRDGTKPGITLPCKVVK